MKQIFRFAAVAMAAALSSSTALAGDWTVPVPAGKDLANLTTADTVYVFNLGQKAWINKGESWGTQAVVNAGSGLKYVIKQAIEENSAAETLSDGRYYLYAHETGKSNHYLKRTSDSKTGTDYKANFVDGANSSGNQIQWEIADLGNHVYSIKRPETFQDGTSTDGGLTWEYVDGEYLGVNLSHDRLWDGKTWEEAGYTEQPQTLALWFDTQMSDYAKWIFVSPADYQTYAEKYTLKDALDKAEAKGVKDYAAEEAVFNNANATSEEIANAVLSLNNKIADLVSPENPVDYTSSIQNPNFNDGNISGWTSTTKAQNNATATNVCEDKAANPDGAFDGKFYENWNGSAFSGKMYQEVKNLPNGIYHCSLAAYTQQFDLNNATNKKQYVYFNDTKLPLTTGNAKKYEAYIDVTNNTIEMGLAQDSAISQWMGIDNAQLEYYGNGLASYQFVTTNFQTVIDAYTADGVTMGDTYKNALVDLIAQAKAATTKDDAFAIYGKAQNALADLEENVQAYKDLAAFYEQCNKWFEDLGSDIADEACTTVTEMLSNTKLTTKEINDYIADITAKIDEEIKNNAQPGDDVTKFITNPAFTKATDPDADPNAAQDFSGWTLEGKQPGAGGTVDKRLCEVYEGDFNIYQDLKGIQKGAYKLELQAFMRFGGADAAYQNYVAQTENIPAYIYAGDYKQTVKSIFDWHAEGEAPTTSTSWSNIAGTDPVWYVPNTMVTAYEAMAQDPENYNNVVTALCVDGNMRIGLASTDPANTGSRWFLFHDFKLTYLGNDPAVISPVLTELVTKAETIAEQPMAADESKALATALTDANKAIADNDGNAMMTAYRALNKAIDAANTSVAAYVELNAVGEKLVEAIENYQETATPEALATANALSAEISAGIQNGSIKTEDVNAKVVAANLAIHNLRLQPGSDETPADFSWAIKNSNMADGTANWTCVKGTATPGVADNVMEGYNGTFDVYQDIENMPKGTYLVKCQGFYRYGWVDANGLQKAYAKDSLEYNGKLYANADTVSLKSIILMNEIALNAGGSNWKNFYEISEAGDTINTYYLPDQRNTANERFMVEAYPNELYTYVNESGHLRIGFCSKKSVTGDWTTASYFQLFYLGEDSKHAGETGIEDINNAKVVRSEFYTIDGRRVNGLSRGLNIIKTTDVTGKTIVRKVMVK